MNRTLFLFFFLLPGCYIAAAQDSSAVKPIYRTWLSTDFLNCLQHSLPCECMRGDVYLLYEDTAARSIDSWMNAIEPSLRYSYTPQRADKWQLRIETYGETSDTAIAGSAEYSGAGLLLKLGTGPSKRFELAGYVSEWQGMNYAAPMNAALTSHGYDSLHVQLAGRSAVCFCSPDLGGETIVSTDNGRSWLLEKRRGKLLIYEWLNPPDSKPVLSRYDARTGKVVQVYCFKKRLFRSLKW